MRSALFSALAAVGLLVPTLVPALAHAHIEINSGPATANASNKITFAVGHGCTTQEGVHLDTLSVQIDIPANVTSVRALPNSFASNVEITLVPETTDVVKSILWTRGDTANVGDHDLSYYEVTIRARMPNTPFVSIPFTVTQKCSNKAGDIQRTVIWGSSTENPAPSLRVVAPRRTGWTKVTIPAGVTLQAAELAAFFGDAQIVWRGNAAYSASADISAMITTTPGVTALTPPLNGGDVLWVRY